TYSQAGDRANSFDALVELASSHGVAFEESRQPVLKEDELTLIIGWQFLLHGDLTRCVVFHDSLLPEFRGFSRTVTAVFIGRRDVGVTAFKPVSDVDAGPIYGQRTVQIPPDANIQVALDLQSEATVALALEIIRRVATDSLAARTQDETNATHSLWRDSL